MILFFYIFVIGERSLIYIIALKVCEFYFRFAIRIQSCFLYTNVKYMTKENVIY